MANRPRVFLSLARDVADELERIRVERAVPKTEVAVALQIDRTSVGRKLRGDTPFTVGEAYILAIFLGTRLQDVLTMVETRLHDDESLRG